MSDQAAGGSPFHGRLRAAAGWLFWLGIALLVIGIAAIVFPIVSSLVATLFVGWILLLAGIVAVAGAFSIHGTGPFFGAMLLGLFSAVAGLFLLFNPLAGEVALTLLLGAIFLIQGATEAAFALEMRPQRGWIGVFLSGALSVAAAILIAIAWPGVSLVVLGILLGVNFISTGLAYLSVARLLKAG